MSISPFTDSGTPTRHLAVLASAAGLSAWAMDVAATQVALPTMQDSLGLSVTGGQWLLNLSIMVLAGLVTVGGAIGDRMGRVQVFRLGALVLATGAFLVMLGGLGDQNLVVFVGRFVEGVGAAFVIPASTALLIDVFTPEARGAAQGKAFAYSMLATAIAPMVAGVIVQRVGWQWTYLLPIALSVITIIVLHRISLPPHEPVQSLFDYLGAALLFVTVTALIFGFMQAGANGWSAPEVAGSLFVGLAVGVALVLVEVRREAPLIQLRLLRIRSVAIAMSVGVLRFMPPIVAGAFVARFAQEVLALTPTQTGMLVIVPTLTQFFTAPVAGRLQDAKGPRLPVPIGILLMLAGSLLLVPGFSDQRLLLIIIATAFVGAGFAFTNPLAVAALNETPLRQRGMLSGLIPLSGQFGSALWVSVVTALLVSGMDRRMANGADAATAQAEALGRISWVVVGVMTVALVIALALPKPTEDTDIEAVAPART